MGMGAATARVFADEGAAVLVTDLNEPDGQATVDAIAGAGGTASFLRTDVSRAADVEAMVRIAVERYGRLDCAVNNAAVTPDTHPIAELDEAEFDRKHGVIGLTKVASLENAPNGIRVNAVCPGAIDTPMLRGALETFGATEAEFAPALSLLGRFGRPEEVAQASLWLCSERASYVTGAALAVDAGYTSR
ncbi:MAG: SDR family oxidoreductase [Nocardioidaceae bacterium]